MSDLRIPDIPLPRPFLRVLNEEPVTKEDVERVRKNLQQTIEILQTELRRERELTKKLEKSGQVLQDILSAPDFRALSLQTRQIAATAEALAPGTAQVNEPPVEYVEVLEIELNDTEVQNLETTTGPKKPDA